MSAVAGREGERGFTLVELLITMTLGLACFGGVLGALGTMVRQSALSRNQSEAQDEARSAMARLSVGLRNALAAPGATPTAVERADEYDIVFQTVDPFVTGTPANKLGAMRARYCLDRTVPARAVMRLQTQRRPTGPPALPASGPCDAQLNGWDDNRVIAEDLVDQGPVWTYSPSGGGTPALIRSVGTSLAVDIDPTDPLKARTLSSVVGLRNANRPPVVSLSFSQPSGVVVLSASASYDPDGDGMSYRWFIDGVEQPGETGVQFKRSGLTPGSYTFKVVVTDTAGLGTPASRTEPVQ